MTQLTAVSLFAGVGGFDLAMERLGIEVVANCEIDKHASKVLARRFPKAAQFQDVREVTGDQLRTAGFVPEQGIITGGFPCQDLSVAGKRLGFTGKRSSLFYEIARLADETKAKYLVLENVVGLLSSQRGADMGAVVGTLVDLGYSVGWRVLDAQNFGVPQRRRRVFIVAKRDRNPTSPAKILFERTSLRGDNPKDGTQGQETATGVDGSLDRSDFEPTLYEPHHGDGRSTEGIANTLQARMGTGGNNVPVACFPIQGTVINRQPQNGPAKGFGEEGAPMFTPTGYGSHALASDLLVRRLTPVECERLQGFPDNWTEGQADSHRYKQMGNAVAVPVVEWVMKGVVNDNRV